MRFCWFFLVALATVLSAPQDVAAGGCRTRCWSAPPDRAEVTNAVETPPALIFGAVFAAVVTVDGIGHVIVPNWRLSLQQAVWIAVEETRAGRQVSVINLDLGEEEKESLTYSLRQQKEAEIRGRCSDDFGCPFGQPTNPGRGAVAIWIERQLRSMGAPRGS